MLADFAYVVITENQGEEDRAEFDSALANALEGKRGDDGRAARREAAKILGGG